MVLCRIHDVWGVCVRVRYIDPRLSLWWLYSMLKLDMEPKSYSVFPLPDHLNLNTGAFFLLRFLLQPVNRAGFCYARRLEIGFPSALAVHPFFPWQNWKQRENNFRKIITALWTRSIFLTFLKLNFKFCIRFSIENRIESSRGWFNRVILGWFSCLVNLCSRCLIGHGSRLTGECLEPVAAHAQSESSIVWWSCSPDFISARPRSGAFLY